MTTIFHTTPYTTFEQRQTAASLSKPERQKLIKGLLVTYPIFDKMVGFIREFHYPAGPDGLPGSGAIGGLLGKTGVGKSDICKFYGNAWPSVVTEDGVRFPVVYINATGEMTPSTFCEAVYLATGAQSAPGGIKSSAYIRRAVERLLMCGCVFLILDDAQFLFCGRVKSQVNQFYSFLKQAVDTEAMNILLVGENDIEPFVKGNPPLHRRGNFPKMPLTALGEEGDEFEQFRLLLRKVDNRLPFLEASHLDSKEYAEDFHLFSGGALGMVMNLIRYAGYRALAEGTSHITREHLQIEASRRRRTGDSYFYFDRPPTPTKRRATTSN